METKKFKINSLTQVFYGQDDTKETDIPYLYPMDEVEVEPVSGGVGGHWYRVISVASISGNTGINYFMDAHSEQPIYIRCLTNQDSPFLYNAIELFNSNSVITTKVSNEASKQTSDVSNRTEVIRDIIRQITLSINHAVIQTNFENEQSSENTARGYNTNIRQLRGVLGAPHQFLPTADPRMDADNHQNIMALGRTYYTHILKTMPLLFITPGKPKFVPTATISSRSKLVEMIDKVTGTTDESSSYSGKYYTLEFDYTTYFRYVTPMLRMAAIWLGLENVEMDDKRLPTYNWLFGNTSGLENQNTGWPIQLLARFLGRDCSSVFGRDCIIFYANCGENTSDSFSNSIGQSSLANTINNLSDSARELRFIVGSGGAAMGDTVNKIAQDLTTVAPSSGERGIVQSIVDKCRAIMSGGRLVFPQIWTDSNFSRSYSCTMKLVSPSGDKLSVFLNILVPIFHILGFSVAKQTNQGGQTYESPFLVRAYYKGMFNVDMGIIESLSITKGIEGEWTVDGIPTVADVTFEIKDLYDGMFISESKSNPLASILQDPGTNFMSNITELDYIANCCGVNVNQMEGARIGYFVNKMYSVGSDIAGDLLAGIGQYAANVFQQMFGTF